MSVFFPDLRLTLTDRQFEEISKLCENLRLGVISGLEFERRARALSPKLTRAVAYAVCRAIREGRYVRVIKWTDVLVSVSLRTTSTRGLSSERYFEGRLIAPVPYELRDEVAGDVESAIYMTCDEIDYLGDLLLKCIYMYFESKGYESIMLDTATWYAGVQYLRDYEAPIDKEVIFDCTIYDKGSAVRAMNIRRWHDEIPMPKRYWEDLPKACKHFREEAFRRGYLKSMGKQVRW